MLGFLDEYHPPLLDRSTLPALIYEGNLIIQQLTSETEKDFFDQFDQLVDAIIAQVISLGMAGDERFPQLLRLKEKIRDRELTRNPLDYSYYAELKRTYEEFFLLIHEATSLRRAQEIVRNYLLRYLYSCGPGLLDYNERSLTTLKSSLHYQAFLAKTRENLIDNLASQHIVAKGVAEGYETHVAIFIAHDLAQYAFTPLRRVPREDPFAHATLCKVAAGDCEKFRDLIRHAYTPSIIIPQLTEDLVLKFKDFFQKEGLPFNVKISESAEKLASFYQQLGLDPALYEILSPANDTYLITTPPSQEIIESCILEEFLKTHTHTFIEPDEATLTAAQPVTRRTLIVANDHFYDEVAEASRKLANDQKIVIQRSITETGDYFYQAGLKGLTLDTLMIRRLYQAGIRDFRGVTFINPDSANIADLKISACNFQDTIILMQNCVSLDKQKLLDFINAGVKIFRIGNDTVVASFDLEHHNLHLNSFFSDGINTELFKLFYKLGARNFENLDLRYCTTPLTREALGMTETDAPLQLKGAIINADIYYFLKSIAFRDFDQITLGALPSNNRYLEIDAAQPEIFSVKKFSLIQFVGDFSGVNLFDYEFKDCSFPIQAPKLFRDLTTNFTRSLYRLLYSYVEHPPFYCNRMRIEKIRQALRPGNELYFWDDTIDSSIPPETYLRNLRRAIGAIPLKPTGELMTRIRFAIEHHSCFGTKTVDEVLREYFTDMPSAALILPFATVNNSVPSAGAGAAHPGLS